MTSDLPTPTRENPAPPPVPERDAASGRLTGRSIPSGRGAASVLLLVGIVAAFAVIAVLAFALREPGAALQPGEPAPDFTLNSFEGEQYELSALRGRVIVLNFWASWCIECSVEAADLVAVWREFQDRGVLVLGVDYTDTEAAALDYLERLQISYPNGPDLGARISSRYGLTGVPETVLIDREGRIVPLRVAGEQRPLAKIVGPIVPGGGYTPDDLRNTLEALLADGDVGSGATEHGLPIALAPSSNRIPTRPPRR